MNILLINSARRWGGNEQWTNLAAKCLKDHHNVYLAYRSTHVGERFEIRTFKLPFWSELDPITLHRLTVLVKQYEIDTLLPTKRKDYVLSGLTSRLCGVNNVIRLGIVRELRNDLIHNLIYNVMCNGIIVNAQLIQTVLCKSPFMKPRKIRVIYNGVDIRSIRKKAGENIHYRKHFPFMIATLAELSKRKGHALVMRAFGDFLHKACAFDRAGLLLIGAGSERDRLNSLAHQLEIEKNVFFTGFQLNPFSMEESSILLNIPLFHVTGCYVMFLSCFRTGRKMVMMYKWLWKVKLSEHQRIH